MYLFSRLAAEWYSGRLRQYCSHSCPVAKCTKLGSDPGIIGGSKRPDMGILQLNRSFVQRLATTRSWSLHFHTRMIMLLADVYCKSVLQ
jgi:hypothetical protein